jgi:hypothetical protein
MVAALRAYLVAPVHKGSPTVKINVAWTENGEPHCRLSEAPCPS